MVCIIVYFNFVTMSKLLILFNSSVVEDACAEIVTLTLQRGCRPSRVAIRDEFGDERMVAMFESALVLLMLASMFLGGMIALLLLEAYECNRRMKREKALSAIREPLLVTNGARSTRGKEHFDDPCDD